MLHRLSSGSLSVVLDIWECPLDELSKGCGRELGVRAFFAQPAVDKVLVDAVLADGTMCAYLVVVLQPNTHTCQSVRMQKKYSGA